MFIGHFGVAFAAKKIDNRPSLGTMFFAAQFIDLIWPILLLLGLEKVKIDPDNTAFTPLDFIYYPISHSLFGVFIWAILFGGVYYLLKKNLRNSVLLGLLVLSHWILDLVVHRPDLPLVPWAEMKVGFGLWNSVLFSIVIEVIIYGAGAYLYFKSTVEKNKKGFIGLLSLLFFLLLVYFMNIFGPPPPAEEPIAYAGLALWLLVAWAYWVDKNRSPVK